MNSKKISDIKKKITENSDYRDIANCDSKIKITGTYEALVEGCLGVSDYTETSISLVTVSGNVTVTGIGVELILFEGGEAVIKGKFVSVSFD